MDHLNQSKKSDPAKVILHAIESIIKFLLMVPFMLYSRIGEPILHLVYETYLLPTYQRVISAVPFAAPVFKFGLYTTHKFMDIFTSAIERFSGSQSEKPQKLKSKGQKAGKERGEYDDIS